MQHIWQTVAPNLFELLAVTVSLLVAYLAKTGASWLRARRDGNVWYDVAFHAFTYAMKVVEMIEQEGMADMRQKFADGKISKEEWDEFCAMMKARGVELITQHLMQTFGKAVAKWSAGRLEQFANTQLEAAVFQTKRGLIAPMVPLPVAVAPVTAPKSVPST